MTSISTPLPWSEEELELLEAIRPSMSTKEIKTTFKLLGLDRSIEAIAKKSRQLGVKLIDLGFPPTSGLSKKAIKAIKEIIKDREDQQLANNLDNSLCVLTPSEKAQATTKKRNFAREIQIGLNELRSETPRTSSISSKLMRGQGKESLIVELSDQHIGRIFHNEEYEEIYNIDIGIKRIQETPDRVFAALTKDQRENIDEVVILLIGDHVDGEGIFPAQEMHLEEHAVEQVKRCTKAFWFMIKRFREVFPMVRIITTKGNHGRSGTSPESNWDNVLFQQLELLVDVENDPNLTIKNRYGDYNTFEVKGWKGLVRHKACVQADSPSGIAKFAGWHGIHQWDFFGFGHFHHWGILTWNGKPIFRNGSMMGGDDYAETLGYYDNPTQVCFAVSERDLPTFVIPIRYDTEL